MFFPIVAIRRVFKPLGTLLANHEIFQDATVLDLVKAHPRFTVEQEKTEDLAEGTANTAAEKVSFETSTFRVTSEYLQQLRDIFSASPVVDIILMDIACPGGTIYDLRGMRPHIALLAQNDDSAIIKLTAEYIRSTCDQASPVVEHTLPADYGLVIGTVTKVSGEPVPDVFVVGNKPAAGTHICFTSTDGKFLVFGEGGVTITLQLTKTGYLFPAGITATPAKNFISTMTVTGA